MPTKKNLINLVGGALLLLAALFTFQTCNRNKRVSGHTDIRQNAMLIDSIQTAESRQRRRALDSLDLLLRLALDAKDTVYRQVTKYDTKLEIRYRDRPTLELCDSVIHSKNHRIHVLESKDSLHTQLAAVRDSVIINLDSLVTQKDITISTLNTGYRKATEQLDKLGSRRVVVSVGPSYGIGADLKPRLYMGVNVGFKVFEF